MSDHIIEHDYYDGEDSTDSDDSVDSALTDPLNPDYGVTPDPNDTREDAPESLPPTEFDLNIPAVHSYLGKDMTELRGRTILDEGIHMNMPLFIKECVILFPGQTLPMAVFEPNMIDLLHKCIKEDRTFCVVASYRRKAETFGTTAEIIEFGYRSPEGGFRLKAKGRQRFKILKTHEGFFKTTADVRILPDSRIPHPFTGHRIASFDRLRSKPTNEYQQKQQNKIERFEAAVTPWPSWIIKDFDPYILAEKVRHQLQYIDTQGSIVPTDPIELTYWAAQNLSLKHRERMMLLIDNCVLSRLRWILKYLVEERVYICINCNRIIGRQSNVFSMSKEGPQHNFCNASGHIHDTITLYETQNIVLGPGVATTINTWFPGYAWTIAACKGCAIHMGWLFTQEKGKKLIPPSFWLLTRRSVRSKRIRQKNEEEETSSSSEDSNNTESDTQRERFRMATDNVNYF